MKYRNIRHPSNHLVRMITPAGSQKARLIDINSGGARIIGQFTLNEGDRVVVSLRTVMAQATVRWVGDGRAGLAFQPQLSQRIVDEISECIIQRGPMHQRFDSSMLREMR